MNTFVVRQEQIPVWTALIGNMATAWTQVMAAPVNGTGRLWMFQPLGVIFNRLFPKKKKKT
jgi:hypothetical protein